MRAPGHNVVARIPFANGRVMRVAVRSDAMILMLESEHVGPSFVIAGEAIAPLIEAMRAFVDGAPSRPTRVWSGDGPRPPGVPRGRVAP